MSNAYLQLMNSRLLRFVAKAHAYGVDIRVEQLDDFYFTIFEVIKCVVQTQLYLTC